jgi:hypothetical protein
VTDKRSIVPSSARGHEQDMLKPGERADHPDERFHGDDGRAQHVRSAQAARSDPTPIQPTAEWYHQQAADHKGGVPGMEQEHDIG